MKFTAFLAFRESAHWCLVRGPLKEISDLCYTFSVGSLHYNCPIAPKPFLGKRVVRELNTHSQQPAQVVISRQDHPSIEVSPDETVF